MVMLVSELKSHGDHPRIASFGTIFLNKPYVVAGLILT